MENEKHPSDEKKMMKSLKKVKNKNAHTGRTWNKISEKLKITEK